MVTLVVFFLIHIFCSCLCFNLPFVFPLLCSQIISHSSNYYLHFYNVIPVAFANSCIKHAWIRKMGTIHEAPLLRFSCVFPKSGQKCKQSFKMPSENILVRFSFLSFFPPKLLSSSKRGGRLWFLKYGL